MARFCEIHPWPLICYNWTPVPAWCASWCTLYVHVYVPVYLQNVKYIHVHVRPSSCTSTCFLYMYLHAETHMMSYHFCGLLLTILSCFSGCGYVPETSDTPTAPRSLSIGDYPFRATEGWQTLALNITWELPGTFLYILCLHRSIPCKL